MKYNSRVQETTVSVYICLSVYHLSIYHYLFIYYGKPSPSSFFVRTLNCGIFFSLSKWKNESNYINKDFISNWFELNYPIPLGQEWLATCLKQTTPNWAPARTGRGSLRRWLKNGSACFLCCFFPGGGVWRRGWVTAQALFVLNTSHTWS